MEKDIYILAIESSCDETAAAVVKNGREVLSNVISSQIELHNFVHGSPDNVFFAVFAVDLDHPFVFADIGDLVRGQ